MSPASQSAVWLALNRTDPSSHSSASTTHLPPSSTRAPTRRRPSRSSPGTTLAQRDQNSLHKSRAYNCRSWADRTQQTLVPLHKRWRSPPGPVRRFGGGGWAHPLLHLREAGRI